MLKQRVISAVAMAAVFLCALLFLPWVGFVVFSGAVFLIGAWEWANLSGFESKLSRLTYPVAIAFIALGLGHYCAWAMDVARLKQILIAGCCWWALALLWVQGYPSSAVLWKSRAVRAVIGAPVLVPAWLASIYLHQLESGIFYIFIVVIAVACADVGAYFFGRAWGRRKLMVSVSPGKSWEGVWGGVFVTTLLAIVLAFVCDPPLFYTPLLVVIPVSLVSVLGDLLESMLKRERGIKDSSRILPGHGGVLDRVDGLVAAVPVFTLLLIETGWGH